MKVSVIVPVYETWELVPGLVERLQSQTIDSREYEVILVDNGSSVVDEASLPAGYILLKCEKPGSYAARNRGVESARGEVLAFTDSDCLPEPDWLANLVEGIGSKELRAGAVAIRTRDKPNWVERFDSVKGIPQVKYVSRGYAATANLAVPARLLRSLGGFDESRFSGGDAEFCRRAVAHGARLRYVDNAVVGHPARTTWNELVTKARRVKGGQIRNGPLKRRLLWVLRTLFPPVIEWKRIVLQNKAPVSDRLVALTIESGLWLVRMVETTRLVLGANPERR